MQSFAYVGSWVCAGEGREHGFDSSISAVRSSTHKAERQKWIPLLSCRRFFFFRAPRCQTDDRQLRLPDGSERGPPSRARYGIALQDEIETT